MTRLVPLADAAIELGIPAATLRKRVKAGAIRGERRQTPQGFHWVVEVPGGPPGMNGHAAHAPTVDQMGTQSGARTGDQSPDQTVDQPGTRPAQTAVLAQRAEEMAVYSERLLAPYVRRIEEQAEEIGRLKEQLAAATNGHAKTQSAPLAEWPTGRSWWQRLLFS